MPNESDDTEALDNAVSNLVSITTSIVPLAHTLRYMRNLPNPEPGDEIFTLLWKTFPKVKRAFKNDHWAKDATILDSLKLTLVLLEVVLDELETKSDLGTLVREPL